MRVFSAAALILGLTLISGCLCCGTKIPGLDGGQSTDAGVGGQESDGGGGQAPSCSQPYIEYGDGCCLDANGNSICDNDEESETTDTLAETETTLGEGEETATTLESSESSQTTLVEGETTTTQAGQTTVTVKVNAEVASCVSKAGYETNKVIYAYSNNCGGGAKTELSTYSARKGVDFQYIDLGTPNEKEKVLLMCFDLYSPTKKLNIPCPLLICPKTGNYEIVTGTTRVTTQAINFLKKCGVAG